MFSLYFFTNCQHILSLLIENVIQLQRKSGSSIIGASPIMLCCEKNGVGQYRILRWEASVSN